MDKDERLRPPHRQSLPRASASLSLRARFARHISARIPGNVNRIFIRARGPAESGVRYTTQEEVVEIGLDGKPVAPHAQRLEGAGAKCSFIPKSIARAPR